MRLDCDFLPPNDARCCVCDWKCRTGPGPGSNGSWCPDPDCPGWLVPLMTASGKPTRSEYYANRAQLLLDEQRDPKWNESPLHEDRLAMLHGVVARAHAHGHNFFSSAAYIMHQDLAALVAEVERGRGIR